MATSKVLAGARVVLPTGIVDDGLVAVEGSRIAAEGAAHAQTVDVRGHWLVPASSTSTTTAARGVLLGHGGRALTAVRTHRLHGTTTVVASTVTDDMDFLVGQAGLLPNSPSRGTSPASTSRAVHLPCRKGAHSEELLRDPDPAEVRKLVDAARGTRKWSRSPPNCPAASTPYGCSPNTA